MLKENHCIGGFFMKRMISLALCAAALLLLCACGQPDPSVGEQAGPTVTLSGQPVSEEPSQPEQSAAPALPTVSGERDPYTLAWDEMNSADFWIALAEEPQAVRMTAEEIRDYNAAIAQTAGTDVTDLGTWADTLSKSELLALLNHYGTMPDSGYYTPDGPLTTRQQSEIGANRNAAAVATENPVQYGFVTRNTILRTFPSAIPLYDSPDSWEYDKAAETAFKIWEPVLVLHTSADGQWYLVQAYDYLGWLPVSDAALCLRATWDSLRNDLSRHCLTVTAARLALDGSFSEPALNGVVLKMGTRLPLETAAGSADNATADNCYIVQLPVRQEDGTLGLASARIPLQEDVCQGFLPYTTEHVLRQAFKLLGHRYGWGGTADGWDCSSICQDIYRTMGLDLPRNSSRQKNIPGSSGTAAFTAGQKTEALSALLPGAMLELPGHQTLYIGRYQGEDFVIHATHGVYDGQGRFYNANSVIVSSVQAGRSNGKTLLENFRGFSLPVALSR